MKTKILLSIIAILFVAVLYLLYLNFQKPTVQISENIPTATTSPTSTPKPLITTKPTVKPTIAPVINKVKILDTSSWASYSCGRISYKLPSEFSHKCITNNDGSNDVVFSSGSYVSNYITIRQYNGGSRRQYWINSMNASESELKKYVRFQETVFGTVSGLDVFASGGWWQGGYGSPILISNGDTIVSIYGGRDYKDQTGEIVRWDVTDSIASTIKFLK